MGFSIRATATYTPRDAAGRFVRDVLAPANMGATLDVGEIVLAEAKVIVPVRTGELRDSGHVKGRETPGTCVADVVFDAPHAAYVEYGTGIVGASSPGAGPYPYSPTWKGMAAQPYLRPALDLVRQSGELLGQFALKMRERLGLR